MIIKALDYLTPIFLIGVGVYLLIKNESTASSLMVIVGGVVCLAWQYIEIIRKIKDDRLHTVLKISVIEFSDDD